MIVTAAALWAPLENLKSRSRQSLPRVHLPVARASEAGTDLVPGLAGRRLASLIDL